MKKQLLSLAVAALAGTAATWAVDYDLSSLGNSGTAGTRYISQLKVNDDAGNPEVTIGPARTNSNGAVYWDLSSQSFTTSPGATVTVQKVGTGEWMHTYFYIDYESDGFNYDLNPTEFIDTNTGLILPGVDLVYYNCFSHDDSHWYNSDGQTVGNNQTYAGTFSFKLPENITAGEYRARLKIAWCSLDPNGRGDVSLKDQDKIGPTGGEIIDFTIKVVEAVYYTETKEETIYNVNGDWEYWACSEQPGGGELANLFNCNFTDYYMNQWTGTAGAGKDKTYAPHYIVVDLKESKSIGGLEVSPVSSSYTDKNNYEWRDVTVFASDNKEDFVFKTESDPDYLHTNFHNWLSAAKQRGEGESVKFTYVVGGPKEKVMFDNNVKGRYILIAIETTATATGSYGCASELAFVTREVTNYTKSEYEAKVTAEIQAKFDAAIAMGELYKKSIPFAADKVDSTLKTLVETPASSFINQADQVDGLVAFILSSLEKDLVTVLKQNATKSLTFFHPATVRYLHSATQGEAFNHTNTVHSLSAFTFEATATEGSFVMKSNDGKYLGATSDLKDVAAVDSKDKATPVSFAVKDGYVNIVANGFENSALGLTSSVNSNKLQQFSTLKVVGLDGNSADYAWQLAEYAEPAEAEVLGYYVFENELKMPGYYISNGEATITSSRGTSNLILTQDHTPNIVWTMTPGHNEGTVRLQNYVTGKYLVTLGYHLDQVSDYPVDLQIANNIEGEESVYIKVYGATDKNCIDANNADNGLIGAYYGTTSDALGAHWLEYKIDETKGTTMQQAVDYYFGSSSLEVFNKTLPYSDELVEEALEKLEAGEATVEELIAEIKDGLKDLIDEIADDQWGNYTLINTRRQNLGQAPYLASIESDDATVVNTLAQALPGAAWRVKAGSEADTYTLYNVVEDKYLGGSPLALVDEDEATDFTVSFTDQGTVNFATGSNLLNIDTNGNNITTYWVAGDAGSQWTMSFLPANRSKEIQWDGLAVVPGTVEFEEYGEIMFDTDGAALSEFLITFPDEYKVDLAGLGSIYAVISEGSGAVAAALTSEIVREGETNTFKVALKTPITEYDCYYLLVEPETFVMTDSEGVVSYNTTIYSGFIVVTYVPENEAFELLLDPEEGTVTELNDIYILFPEGTAFGNTGTTSEFLTIKKDDTVVLTYSMEDLIECFDQSRFGFQIEFNSTGDGIYTLTVPEDMVRSNLGINARLVAKWTVDSTSNGISNVSVSSEPSKVYDLQGRRLNRMTKGINIVDGVKTLIRK